MAGLCGCGMGKNDFVNTRYFFVSCNRNIIKIDTKTGEAQYACTDPLCKHEKGTCPLTEDMGTGIVQTDRYVFYLRNSKKLDEPTAGLDPKQRIIVRNLIAGEAMNRTVIIATHVVSDIEATARTALFLKKGVLIAADAPAALAEAVAGKVFTLTCAEEQVEAVQKNTAWSI